MKWIAGTGEFSLKANLVFCSHGLSVSCTNRHESLSRNVLTPLSRDAVSNAALPNSSLCKWYQALLNFILSPFRKGVSTCLDPSSFRKVQRLICNLKHVFKSSWFLRWTHAYAEIFSKSWTSIDPAPSGGRSQGAYFQVEVEVPVEYLKESNSPERSSSLGCLERSLKMVTLKCWHFLVSVLIFILKQVHI